MKTVANLATYPPRRDCVLRVVADVAPQVDQLNLVLNEYDAPLPELSSYTNVSQIIPSFNTRDTGKFLPDTADADMVFLLDDDLLYPPDYVSRTLALMQATGQERFCAGYHGTIYLGRKWPWRLSYKRVIKYFQYSDRRIARYRHTYPFYAEMTRARYVEQLGSGVSVLSGNFMPPYDFMQGSERFVDVRLALWCFENGVTPLCLPRERGWIKQMDIDDSIYRSFTLSDPQNVADEIWRFAFKVENRGEIVALDAK